MNSLYNSHIIWFYVRLDYHRD